MKRLLLTVGMLLMGMGLVGGAAAALIPTSLLPLDQEVGTHTSAAGAVLGIGLMAAAVNPAANIGWVRAGILYGFVVLALTLLANQELSVAAVTTDESAVKSMWSSIVEKSVTVWAPVVLLKTN